MVVVCPHCSTTHDVDDARVAGRTVRLRCSVCGEAWIVQGSRSQTAAAPIEQPNTARRVRRGTDRDQRDLFATRHSIAEGRTNEAPSSTRASAINATAASVKPSYGMTGERNEQSLLFRVSDLVGATKPAKSTIVPPPNNSPASMPPQAYSAGYSSAPPAHFSSAPPPSSTFSSAPPDEDVIDVRNMCTSGGQVKSRTAPLYVQETPGAAFAMSIHPAPRSNAFAIGGIAAGALALVMAIGVGFAVSRSGDEAAPPRVAAAITRAPTVQVEGPVATTPAAVAPASNASSADTQVASTSPTSSDASAKSTKHAASTSRAGLSHVSSGGTSSQNVSSAAPAAPKFTAPKVKSGGGADPCHCHGNLACAMKCSL